jgi:hypothetical protein
MLSAQAPSGGCITLLTYSEDARAVSWYQGLLTAAEDAQFWKAKLRAEKGGQAVRLWNGDLRFDTVDVTDGWPGTVVHSVTLTGYRAMDLAKAIVK